VSLLVQACFSDPSGDFMLLDLLRLAAAFGAVALMIGFWYWLMSSIGTF
jgi:hypothetical protein